MAEAFAFTKSVPPEVILKIIATGCLHFPRDLDLLEVAVPLLAKNEMQAAVAKILDNSSPWMFSDVEKERFHKIAHQSDSLLPRTP